MAMSAEELRVFLFVPNIIGYVRLVLAVWSFAIALSAPTGFVALYGVSFILDAFDGYAARVLDQCSRLGAVLDMVTDRAGTAGLMIVLSHLYPAFVWHFVCLVMLDLVSHWMRMYATLLAGGESHKANTGDDHWLVALYYNNRFVLGFVCLLNEFFLLFLFAHASHVRLEWLFGPLVVPLQPLLVLLDVILVACTPLLGSLAFALPDGADRSWAGAICVCFPVFVFKQLVSAIQAYKSAREIVATELEEKRLMTARAAKKATKANSSAAASTTGSSSPAAAATSQRSRSSSKSRK